MIAHVVEAVRDSKVDSAFVVTGHDSDKVRKSLVNQNVNFIENNHYNNGLSASIVAGVKHISDEFDAVVICLGDMPLVAADDIDALIAAFAPDQGKTICVPVHHRQQGNPVLWGSVHYPALLCLDGDRGAKAIIAEQADSVIPVERGPEVLRDVDHATALAEINTRF